MSKLKSLLGVLFVLSVISSPVKASTYSEWTDKLLCQYATTYERGIKVFRKKFAGMAEVKKRKLLEIGRIK